MLLAGAIGCAGDAAPVSGDVETPVDSVLAAPVKALHFAVDTVARGLEIPWSLAIVPDGRILLSERYGAIRTIQDGRLLERPWATVNVYARDSIVWPESGLMGIALAPNFAVSGHVFVVATSWRTEGDRTAALPRRLWRRLGGWFSPEVGLRLKTQVIRVTDRDGIGTDPQVIVDDLPANHYHAGGGLAFGPDGKLYVSIGDVLLPELVDSPESLAGKILRYNPDGTIPADNPKRGSAVYASGLRNSQAFVWLPDGTMLAVDHGPSGMPQEGGRAGQDELNAVLPGRNYGWPTEAGWNDMSGSEPPLWVWQAGLAPAGMAIWGGSTAEDSATILIGGLRRRLERVELVRGSSGWQVAARDTVLDGTWGRLRAIHRAPDGALYVTTSNRDARGTATPSDDLLLRLRDASDMTRTSTRELIRVP